MRNQIITADRNQVVKGSLADIAKQTGKSVAETFLDADCIVIVDVSGSMSDQDAPGNKTRYQAACDELASLQTTLPGKIAVLSFSTDTQFCPNGVPTYTGGGTHIAGALDFAKIADVDGMRFVLISDGEPMDEQSALQAARKYKNRIDTIYCGSELRPAGREFLQRLAKASGGQSVTSDRVALLSTKVQMLLAA